VPIKGMIVLHCRPPEGVPAAEVSAPPFPPPNSNNPNSRQGGLKPLRSTEERETEGVQWIESSWSTPSAAVWAAGCSAFDAEMKSLFLTGAQGPIVCGLPPP
jgi:hypothetical protein